MHDERLENMIRDCVYPPEELGKVIRNQVYNDYIHVYVRKLAAELERSPDVHVAGKLRSSACPHVPKADADKLIRLADRIEHCSEAWNWNIHHGYKVMDLQTVNYCRSRYCPNCQKLIQATRLMTFFPVIDQTAAMPGVQLYHVTLTVPNVKGAQLADTVTCMFYAFTRLVQYLKGQVTVKGFPLASWGYRAAFRSLEITYKNRKDDYHPHLHCIIAMSDDLDNTPRHYNIYSRDKNNPGVVRLFSDNELFLQKLWRLIYDRTVVKFNNQNARDQQIYDDFQKVRAAIPGMRPYPVTPHEAPEEFTVADIFAKPAQKVRMKKITLAEIEDMGKSDGYSCIMSPLTDDNYRQVFKYAMKVNSEEAEFMKYRVFKTIFDALYNRRTIAGYGLWYNLPCDDDVSEVTDSAYAELEAMLADDEPENATMPPLQSLIFATDDNYRMISRKAIRRYLSSLDDDAFNTLVSSLPDKDKPAPVDILADISEERKAYWRNVFAAIEKRKHHTLPEIPEAERQKRWEKFCEDSKKLKQLYGAPASDFVQIDMFDPINPNDLHHRTL